MNQAIDRARDLRRNMSDAEAILWSRVCNRQLGGLKVRRQVPIGKYIADFLIEEAKLVIELDDDQHGFDRNARYDAERAALIQTKGYEVIRFWNARVYKNVVDVLDEVLYVATERMKKLETQPPSPETAKRFRPLPRER